MKNKRYKERVGEKLDRRFPLLADCPDCSARDAKPAVKQFLDQLIDTTIKQTLEGVRVEKKSKSVRQETKQNKYLSLEEKCFINEIIEMAKRSGKKFALKYLEDCDKRPCLSVDDMACKRGKYIRNLAKKLTN